MVFVTEIRILLPVLASLDTMVIFVNINTVHQTVQAMVFAIQILDSALVTKVGKVRHVIKIKISVLTIVLVMVFAIITLENVAVLTHMLVMIVYWLNASITVLEPENVTLRPVFVFVKSSTLVALVK